MALLRGGSSSWLAVLIILGVLILVHACAAAIVPPLRAAGRVQTVHPSAGSGTSSPTATAAAGTSGGVGQVTAAVEPVASEVALTATRKVKNLLVGLAPNDADVAASPPRRRRAAAADRHVADRSDVRAAVSRQDVGVLPQRVPADRLHAHRRLQAAAARERRLRFRPVRQERRRATTRSRAWCRTCKTASRSRRCSS